MKTEEDIKAEESEKEEAATTKEASSKSDIYNYTLSHLHTHADTDISYNDNIYRLHKKTGDVIARVRPGVGILLGSNKLRAERRSSNYCLVDAGYTTDCYIRAKLNHNNPYATINIQGAGSHYKVGLNHWFEKAQRPTESISAGSSGLTGYQTNITDLNFEYNLRRMGFEAKYERRSVDYGKSFNTNAIVDQSLDVTASVTPPIMPKTKIFFEYDYGTFVYNRAPSNVNDFTYHYFWLGARGKFLKKFYATFKAGKELRYMYITPSKYKDAFVFRGDLYYRYSQKTWFLLHLGREQRPSTNKASGFDTQYRLSLRAIYNFSPKISFAGGAKYSYDEYKTAGTHDNTYGPFIRLDWKVNKSTKIGIEYNFVRRDTTRANSKYNNNNVIARMGMAF